VPGPADILGPDAKGIHGGSKRIGALDEDLAKAVVVALTADRNAAAEEARHYSWEECTRLFFAGLARAASGKTTRANESFRNQPVTLLSRS
jgi:hypothetical protein